MRLLILLIAYLFIANAKASTNLAFCESIPEQMELVTQLTTYQAWSRLIDSAVHTLDIAQYYWTLTDGNGLDDVYGSQYGMSIYNKIIQAHKRGVRIRIVQNKPSPSQPQTDSANLQRDGVAEVRSLDMSKFSGNPSSGILHTKLLIADDIHAYVGSANMDWRSLSLVKEMGVFITNSTVIGADVQSIFTQYWDSCSFTSLPDKWAPLYDTEYNKTTPLKISFDSFPTSKVYFDVTPKEYCSPQRTDGLDSIVSAINSAKSFINIEVMDYLPTSLYQKSNYYWDAIDRSIRDANYRNVKVNFLVSKWESTKADSIQYLESLNVLSNVEVRYFIVPHLDGVDHIAYSRVNHSKYIVTDQTLIISTNNFTADYFLSTCGVSFVLNDDVDAIKQLQSYFERDWNSKYSYKFSDVPN